MGELQNETFEDQDKATEAYTRELANLLTGPSMSELPFDDP